MFVRVVIDRLSSRHVEHWNVPKMALLRQIFRPSRWVWEKR